MAHRLLTDAPLVAESAFRGFSTLVLAVAVSVSGATSCGADETTTPWGGSPTASPSHSPTNTNAESPTATDAAPLPNVAITFVGPPQPCDTTGDKIATGDWDGNGFADVLLTVSKRDQEGICVNDFYFNYGPFRESVEVSSAGGYSCHQTQTRSGPSSLLRGGTPTGMGATTSPYTPPSLQQV